MDCPENLVFNYQTSFFGHVSSFLQLQEDNILLFRDKQEFRGPGKIKLPFARLNRLMENTNDRSFNLLLTHVSRENKYSEEVTNFQYDYSAPYGTKLLSLPEYPDLLRTNFTYQTKEVNYGAILRIFLGIGIGGFSAYYGEKNEVDELLVYTGIGVGFFMAFFGYEDRYKYHTFSDELKNDINSRINNERISAYEREKIRIETQNQKIKQTYIIRIIIK